MNYPGSERRIKTQLPSGLNLVLRPVTSADKPFFAQGIRQMSDHSRYLRFFSGFREAPEPVVTQLAAADGKTNFSWCAIETHAPETQPVAAVHAIRDKECADTVELAMAVIDAYQGQGISKMLLALVIRDALAEGFVHGTAHILAENHASTHIFVALGGKRTSRYLADNLYSLNLADALEKLTQYPFPKEVLSELSSLH